MRTHADGAVQRAHRPAPPDMGEESQERKADRLLAFVLAKLEDAKAEDIITIDLKGKTAIGDYMVIASGRSQRHVSAVAERLITELKDGGFGRARVEGQPHCDWVLIDSGDVITHIFRPEVRSFYNLEKMWSAERPSDPEPV